jgi:hypothetical protein
MRPLRLLFCSIHYNQGHHANNPLSFTTPKDYKEPLKDDKGKNKEQYRLSIQ